MGHIAHVGQRRLHKGELLQLLVTDPEQGKTELHQLLVEIDADLSALMAQFYRISAEGNRQVLYEAGASTQAFVRHLVDAGVCRDLKVSTVNMGHHGRPSKTLLDEHRYTLNPDEFAIQQILAQLETELITIDLISGARLKLVMGVAIARDTGGSIVVACHNKPVATLQFSLFGNTSYFDITDFDRLSIHTALAEMLDRLDTTNQLSLYTLHIEPLPDPKECFA